MATQNLHQSTTDRRCPGGAKRLDSGAGRNGYRLPKCPWAKRERRNEMERVQNPFDDKELPSQFRL